MPTILRVWTSDWLKLAIGIGFVSGMTALICLMYVVWVNGGSRNLALAAGALGGAIALMIVQLVFELRSPAGEKEVISVEYIIDCAIPNIRQWSYQPRGEHLAGDGRRQGRKYAWTEQSRII